MPAPVTVVRSNFHEEGLIIEESLQSTGRQGAVLFQNMFMDKTAGQLGESEKSRRLVRIPTPTAKLTLTTETFEGTPFYALGSDGNALNIYPIKVTSGGALSVEHVDLGTGDRTVIASSLNGVDDLSVVVYNDKAYYFTGHASDKPWKTDINSAALNKADMGLARPSDPTGGAEDDWGDSQTPGSAVPTTALTAPLTGTFTSVAATRTLTMTSSSGFTDLFKGNKFRIEGSVSSDGEYEIERWISATQVVVTGDKNIEADETATASVKLDPVGGVRGVVKYYISEVDGTTEGALSEVFGTIDADFPASKNNPTGGSVTIDFTPFTNMSSNNYRIYRTFANRATPYYLATVDGATVTKFTDQAYDVELENEPEGHGDQPPGDLVDVVNHFNRLWGIKADGTLYWTDVNQPESWWLTGNTAKIFPNDGDKAVALVRIPDGILVIKTAHIYEVSGRIPSDIIVNEVTTSDAEGRSIGCPHKRAMTLVPGGFAFFWNSDLYIYRDGKVLQANTNVRIKPRTSTETQPVTLGYNRENNRVWMSVSVGLTGKSTEGATVSRTYVFDLDWGIWVGSWLLDPSPRGYLSVASNAWAADSFYANNSTVIYYVDPSIPDTGVDETNIERLPNFSFRNFYGSAPEGLKRFLWVDLVVEDWSCPNATASMKIRFRPDGGGEGVVSPAKAEVEMGTILYPLTGQAYRHSRVRFNVGQYGRNFEFYGEAQSDGDLHTLEILGIEVGIQEFGLNPRVSRLAVTAGG